MEESARDKVVKVLVITAKGRSFSVGASVSYLKEGVVITKIPEGRPTIAPSAFPC